MEDRYEIREKIGQGGIGRVFRGYDRTMNREIAIKRILTSIEDPSLEGEATKQLMAEVEALASLQHPHIITVFDVGQDEEGPYVVMELLNGQNLDQIIEQGPMSWEDFKQVAIQSQEALVAAQELGMVHSDLKPPNIMLTWLASGNIQVKIVDFGLAVLVHNQSQEEIENLDSVFGSIFFMPPEQFERKTLDARSDLYSIGCVYYQALTGTYPFNGETGNAVMAAHLHHEVTPLQQLRADIPIWACEWVMWLINRDPADRPQTAHEALANFHQNEMNSMPVATYSEAPVEQAVPALHSPATMHSTATSVQGVRPSLTQTSSQVSQMAGTALHGPAGSTQSLVNKRNIIIAAAAVVLIGILIGIVMKRNAGVRRGWAYNNAVTMAEERGVKAIPMNGEALDAVLEKVSQSLINHDITIPLKALALAISSDGTDIDTEIASFATQAQMHPEIRRKLFEHVIEERGSESAIPLMKAYVKKTGKGRKTLDYLLEVNGKKSTSPPKPVEQARKPEPQVAVSKEKPRSRQPPIPKQEPTEAIKPLVADLESNDQSVKLDAIRALAQSQDRATHGILLGLLEEETDPSMRSEIIEASIAFNRQPFLRDGKGNPLAPWRQLKWKLDGDKERQIVVLALEGLFDEMGRDVVVPLLQDYTMDRKGPQAGAMAEKILAEREP